VKQTVDYGFTPPWWFEILQMADAWGTDPETLLALPGGAIWRDRWRHYHRAVNALHAQNMLI